MSKNIPLNKIDTERFPNPRGQLDPSSIAKLAASIDSHSQLQPIVVSGGNTSDGRYYLVCGFRRYAAHKLLGRTTIPAVVKRIPVAQVPVVQLIENVDREPLPLLDECGALARIRDSGTLGAKDLAELYGRSQSYITQRISIHRLPDEIKEAFLDGKIQFSDLRDLSGVKADEGKTREEAQIAAFRKALEADASAPEPASSRKKPSRSKRKAATRKAVRQSTRQAKKPERRAASERTGEKPGRKAMEGTTEERLEALTQRIEGEIAKEIGASKLSPKASDAVQRAITKLHQERLLVLP